MIIMSSMLIGMEILKYYSLLFSRSFNNTLCRRETTSPDIPSGEAPNTVAQSTSQTPFSPFPEFADRSAHCNPNQGYLELHSAFQPDTVLRYPWIPVEALNVSL